MPLSEKKPDSSNTQTKISLDTETDRLRRDIFRPDMEKFLLFTQMLRTNAMFNNAKVTHKK